LQSAVLAGIFRFQYLETARLKKSKLQQRAFLCSVLDDWFIASPFIKQVSGHTAGTSERNGSMAERKIY